ncbi:hypothetical protein Pst134EB_010783 [Puccinia striiformis f. sp. tritici]|nr:hypothetical protein Pst134EB_010783 [Puccinia striiformis f. sp. tritici]
MYVEFAKPGPEPSPAGHVYAKTVSENLKIRDLRHSPTAETTMKDRDQSADMAEKYLMTGLDVTVDQIIEIACIITDKDLQELDDGIQFVIHVEQSVLDRMGPWCQNQHGKSGLSESCLQSSHTLTEVDQKIRNYLEHHLPGLKGKAVLAGNSVYADKMFLNKDLPLVAQYLHYRLVDVSSIKECVR